MRRGFVRALSASVVACGLLALPVAASASVTVLDNYFGGANYYNDPGDVIGSSTFDTLSATFERLGSSLRVTINTDNRLMSDTTVTKELSVLSVESAGATGFKDLLEPANNLAAELPFGGFKRSGNGREYGVFGFEEYLETKAIIGYE